MEPTDLLAEHADLRNRLEKASFAVTMLQGELATYKVDREDLRKQVAALRAAVDYVAAKFECCNTLGPCAEGVTCPVCYLRRFQVQATR